MSSVSAAPPTREARRAVVVAGTVAFAVTALFATSPVALTQSDGDLFAHIARGRVLRLSGIPTDVTPAWGSAWLLASVHATGGLSLIALCAATLAGGTQAVIADYWRRCGMSPRTLVIATAFGVAFAASHWLARPHAVTIAASASLLVLLECRDTRARWAIPPLFVLWANLHGGWSYGAIVLGAYVAGERLDAWRGTSSRRAPLPGRSRTAAALGLLAATALATLCTPFGIRLHAAVLHTLADPAVRGLIDEYKPPALREPSDLLFLVVLGASVLVLRRASLPWSHRLVILASAAAALRSGRNISLWAVTGWPLLVVHLEAWHRARVAGAAVGVPAVGEPAVGEPAVAVLTSRVPLVGSALVLLLVLAVGPVRHVAVDPTRFPVSAVRQLRLAGSAAPVLGPLLSTWSWSGYLPYAWPGRRALFDPLAFSGAEVGVLGQLLTAQRGWRGTLDSLGIATVLLPVGSPLADALGAQVGWGVWYRDATAVVFRRRRGEQSGPFTAATRPLDSTANLKRVAGVHEPQAQASDRRRRPRPRENRGGRPAIQGGALPAPDGHR